MAGIVRQDEYRSENRFDLASERGHDVIDRIAGRVADAMGSDAPLLKQPRGVVHIPKIPGCEIRGLLGQGGMGAVYLGWQSRLDRHVAVKVLPFSSALQPHLVARFEREISAVGRLDHPSVVTAYDANQQGGTHYLLMEYVEGETLSQLVRREGPLPIKVACEIVRQAAVGMQHVHESGLVHRDLKPSNLMLTCDGRVRILDLGLARFDVDENRPADEITATGQVMGTIEFMAPEQAVGSEVADAQTDVYGLGATLFKLLRGQSLLAEATPQATSMQRVARLVGAPPTMHDVDTSEMPEPVCQVLERSLAVDAAERFGTAQELAEALLPLCSEFALVEFSTRVSPAECEPLSPECLQETVNVIGNGSTSQAGHLQQREVSPDAPPAALSAAETVRSRSRKLLWTAAALAALLLGAILIRISTDGAEIEITSDDPNIKLEILRNDKLVDDFVVGSSARSTWYRSGDYEIRFATQQNDHFSIVNNVFELTRGNRQVVRIERILNKTNPTNTQPPAVLPSKPTPTDQPSQKLPKISVSSPEQIAKWMGSGPSPTEVLTSDEWEWTQPQRLGTPFNSFASDDSMAISADQTFLAITSRREGGHGNHDLWFMHRTAAEQPWSGPVNAGPTINTSGIEHSPWLSGDGLTLLFARRQSGGNTQMGPTDLFLSVRMPGTTTFEKAVRLGPEINTAESESSPHLTPDGLTLLFVRSTPSAGGEIFQASRSSIDEPFAAAVPVDAVNSPANETFCTMTLDSRTLLFCSSRNPADGRWNGSSFWMSTRSGVEADWSPPSRMSPVVRTIMDRHYALRLSPNGRTAWFISNDPRDFPSSPPSMDIWTTNRVRRIAATPLDVHTGEGWIWTPCSRKEFEPVATNDVTSISLTRDELTMIVAQRKPDSDTLDEVKQFERESRVSPWIDHSVWLTKINQQNATVTSPEISSDGLTLIYSTTEPDSPKDLDLWITTRTTTDSPWNSPVELAEVNSDSEDSGAALSDDGLTLLFHTGRKGWKGAADLWQSQRPSIDAAFEKPVSLGPVLNVDASDSDPTLSSDGCVLMFFSERGNPASGGGGIWMSTRATTDDTWSPPRSLGWAVNREPAERCPELSHDGRSLYFVTAPVGKKAGYICQSYRFKETPIYGGNLSTGHRGPAVWGNLPMTVTISGIDRLGESTGFVAASSEGSQVAYSKPSADNVTTPSSQNTQWMLIRYEGNHVIWNAARQECLTATGNTKIECRALTGDSAQFWKHHEIRLGQEYFSQLENQQHKLFLSTTADGLTLLDQDSARTGDDRFNATLRIMEFGGDSEQLELWKQEATRVKDVLRAASKD